MGLPVLTPFAGDSKFGVLIEGKGKGSDLVAI